MDLTQTLMNYWSLPLIQGNFIVVLNLIGALALGFMLGYERTYHGRAAGMRTYGLVCMASAGIVLVSGYPDLWFGGHVATVDWHVDPTRSIQGIVTGIGFLGAGVIMKDGFSISGLTTAASLWTASAIGIMVGMGLYPSAIFFTFGAIACMTIVSKVEQYLPSRPAVSMTLRFKAGFSPRLELIHDEAKRLGFSLLTQSIAISHQQGRTEWHFIVLAIDKVACAVLPHLADQFQLLDGVEDVNVAHARI
jgi:putative Mg2+ transporter-C (MgtC) family protein